jgi:hypothetical protein
VCVSPPSTAKCGLVGRACVSCGAPSADGCLRTGACGCGTGPACSDGQRCVGGTCVCDPALCGGCCQGRDCLAGTQKRACGRDGGVCVDCGAGQQCRMSRCQ